MIVVAQSLFAAEGFPIEVGTRWDYQVTDSSARTASPAAMNVTIAGIEEVEGKDALSFETRVGEELTRRDFLTVDARGVLCVRRWSSNGRTQSFHPPQQWWPAEFKIGTQWELDDEVAGNGMHQKFTVEAEEDVTVPAGTFHAFRCTCAEPWPIAISIQRWFVPGVGLVKDITTTRGPNGRLLNRVRTVLQKFSPPGSAAPNENESPSPSPSPSPTPPRVVISLGVSEKPGGESGSDFRSDTPQLFVRWRGVNLPKDVDVRLAWVAEDVGDLAPPNFVVDEKETKVDLPEFGAQITLSRPKDGWAPGKYRADLFLDDQLVASVPVIIHD
jgi:hypothetical protein